MGKALSTYEEKMNAYRILVEKLEGKRQQRRPSRKLENNIKMDLREIRWSGMDWSHMTSSGLLWLS
jgi:hypothetical protein